MEIDLSKRIAVVTGAGRGLGKAMAIAFAESGASVVLVDLDAASIQKVSKELSSKGTVTATFRADVSRKQEVNEVVKQAVAELGRIDILVNNAGIVLRKPMLEYADSDWDRVIDVNLGAPSTSAMRWENI